MSCLLRAGPLTLLLGFFSAHADTPSASELMRSDAARASSRRGSHFTTEEVDREQTLVAQPQLIDTRPGFTQPALMMAGGTLAIGGGIGLGAIGIAIAIFSSFGGGGEEALTWLCLGGAAAVALGGLVLIIAGIVSLVAVINARADAEAKQHDNLHWDLDRPPPIPSAMVGPTPSLRIASF